jgi:hypothetical protein
VAPNLGLIAHTTKGDALERPTEGTSNRLTQRSLCRTWRPDEAKHMFDDVLHMTNQLTADSQQNRGLDVFCLREALGLGRDFAGLDAGHARVLVLVFSFIRAGGGLVDGLLEYNFLRLCLFHLCVLSDQGA